jgi:hypothetical protein
LLNLSGSAVVYVSALASDIIQPDSATFTADITIPDKIVHAGDTNTAIRFPAADTVTVETSGIERLRITSDGDVGIGTTTPNQPLQVVRSGATNAGIAITNTTGNSNLFLSTANTGTGAIFFGDTDNFQSGILQYAHTTDSLVSRSAGDIRWQTGGANERLRVTSTGNVGIGTTSPLARLHVAPGSSGASLNTGVTVAGFFEAAANASIQVSSGTGSPAYLFLGDAADPDAGRISAQDGFLQIAASGASDFLQFATGGFTERMRITSAGNVGIGTNSPATTLDVLGATSDQIRLRTDSLLFYRFGRNSSTGLMDFWGSQTGFTGYTFGGVDGERMRITSAGNVGIGTTNPGDSLTVARTGATAASIGVRNNTGDSSILMVAQDTGQSAITFSDQTATSGNITYLHSTDTFRVRSEGVIFFMTGGANERMRITSTGNVGIGTTTPATTLDVNGDVTITDKIIHSGDTDTAIRFPAADTVTVETAGSERLRITSTGNVGIGTSSPSTRLHVSGTTTLDGGYTEKVFAITDGATVNLDPNNGSIQTWTLGAGRTPGQENWAAGQSITLMIDDGTANTITWTTLAPVWETNGGVAPTLATSGFTVIVLWKVATTIYGARVGNA